MSDLKPVTGAGGVVFNKEGKVLILKHKNINWVFPKGHIEKTETKIEAAIREVEEESGVVADLVKPVVSFKTSYINASNTPREITWYLMTTNATKPILREEVFPKGKFVKPAKAMKKLAYSNDKDVLEHMLSHYS